VSAAVIKMEEQQVFRSSVSFYDFAGELAPMTTHLFV
jgi:hypothetical protein